MCRTQLKGVRDAGLSTTNAKMVFMWAQTCCSDEIQKRQRVQSLAFIEFCEAIARVAEMLMPPTPEEEDGVFRVLGFRVLGFRA